MTNDNLSHTKSFEWWHKTFNAKYFSSYSEHIGENQTNKEVDFIIKKAGLKKKNKIIDFCCGQGRHSLLLASKGYVTTGIDVVNESIMLAKKNAKKMNVKASFLNCDVRTYKGKTLYDVALLLYTSLGYSSVENDRMILKNIFRALKNGGKLVIDVYDGDRVYRESLKKGIPLPKNNRLYFEAYNREGVPTFDIKVYEIDNKIENVYRFYIHNRKPNFYQLHIRYYLSKELKDLIKSCGFKVVKTWGDFDGSKKSIDTSRNIIIAKK